VELIANRKRRLFAAAARATLPALSTAARRLCVVALAELCAAEMAAATRIGNLAIRSALDLSCIRLAHIIFLCSHGNRRPALGQMAQKSILRGKISLGASGAKQSSTSNFDGKTLHFECGQSKF
jgi:hypothetical protein